MLTAHLGCEVTVIAEGPEAEQAMDGVCALISDRFGEGEDAEQGQRGAEHEYSRSVASTLSGRVTRHGLAWKRAL